MHRKLTAGQIRSVCEEMLLQTDSPSVRSVMSELRRRYGACGRTERVAEILGALTEKPRPSRPSAESVDLAEMRQRLLGAEERAARAEERERRHQDFWAARYQEKLVELQYRAAATTPSGVSSEQYLRLYQRATELARRLARYEDVEPLLSAAGDSFGNSQG